MGGKSKLGLLDKTIIQKWGKRNKKHFINKGYQFTKMEDEFKVDVKDLSSNSHAEVNVRCDNCKIEKLLEFRFYKKYVKNNKYFCKKCTNKLYKKVENEQTNQEIQKIVNDKLGVNWKVSKLEYNKFAKVTLVDSEGYIYDEVAVHNIKKERFPMKFSQLNKYTKHNINNWLKLNNIKLKLSDKYVNASSKTKWQCLNCDNTFERSWHNIKNNRISCPHCSDTKSYPEKIGLSLFNQLNIEYKHDSVCDWSQDRRYDFIIEDLKLIVEVHGMQHYEEKNWKKESSRTLKQEQQNDKFKKELAEKNGYKYIEIDARYSNIEWIKNSVLNSELSDIYNLSKINWLKCHEYAINSLVKEVCDLWNSGVESIKEIENIMKLSKTTIIKYLKQGSKLNLCNYTPTKPVIQLDLYYNYVAEFKSASEAERQTKIHSSNISAVCRGRYKTSHGYKFMYKEDWDKYIKQQKYSHSAS